ncbi:multisubunit sodium/proton antiporter MrpA subunit [Anoxybacillus vitaminiphilus]|uniref:Multisubunit sodium/proton antiporter MrpA subunit n=1 Tax=Paranoxybacillus vitaminiphilus TaxID=581036 RepID=A0A327YS50_9BACL|nr:Na+/H+ antiporter subunit A [Anoxybacillus vitaminiphilus]RAK23146.1 multisubunit sodium/proton antiporter MrpA subunit [Anoxybacillus vitaminiphilus]
MSTLHWAMVAPFMLALFVPFLYKHVRSIHTGWFILPLPVALFFYFIRYMDIVQQYETVTETVPWIPSLNIHFTAYVDGLSLLFSLLITGIGSLVVLYSIYYLEKEKEKLHHFYVYLLLFMGAMLGVVLSDHLITLYLFWELTSISSFLLIAYWYKRERSRYGAKKSMLITMFGGLLMLGGFLALSVMGDTYSIRELLAHSSTFVNEPLFSVALLLILLGAFTKSAQFPFYIWLPDAMEAPTPVSAYLHSATMVKAGIYLVARLTPIFALSPLWIWLVGGTGIVTLFWASFLASRQTDLKGILAYSTVSQLGLIMSLLGIGALAFHYNFAENIFIVATLAAVFHLFNHATFKGSLFMVVGIVDHETGTRDIRRLGGLMTVMPMTFTIALIGSLSMAGLPPFNGFLSKEMFFTAMLRVLEADIFSLETWGILFPVLAWCGSVFTFLYSFLLISKTFLGEYRPERLEKEAHEAPVGMLLAPMLLALLVIVIGFVPNILSDTVLAPAVYAVLNGLFKPGEGVDVHIAHWHGWTPEVFMTLGVIAVGTVVYKTFPKWNGVYRRLPERLSLNHLYNRLLEWMEKGSFALNERYMTGSVRTYLIYIFTAIIALLSVSIVLKGQWNIEISRFAPVGIYEIVLAVVIVAGALTTLVSKSRLTSIIALGSVGYTVALFFVLFRAPDLALTQLVIETISVALFLLCFYHLPKLRDHGKGYSFKLTNAIISIAVGVVVSTIAFLSHAYKPFESISQYYVENTYEKAAGKNMVNVILVDFRGFDTLFEICVLAIAALGIYGMIKLRMTKEEKLEK